MNYKFLPFLFCLLALITQSCFQLDMDFDNSEEIEIAKKAMQAVKTGNKEELKLLMHDHILRRASEDQIDALMLKSKQLLNLAEQPNDSLIQISNNVNFRNFRKIEQAMLSIPFTLKNSAQKDSIVHLNIGVSNNKIVDMHVNPFPYGRRIIEPKHSEPHLTEHSLKYESIKWFRIWYGSGFEKNEYGDKYGYYAVSGNKRKIDKLNIETDLSQLFELINSTKPDSVDFNYMRENSVGDPEYIYLRFKFDNSPYDKFGEFSIYHHLKDEPGKVDPMSKYISVKHSNKTRYLYVVKNNLEMEELLKKISYNKYDKYFENRWM